MQIIGIVIAVVALMVSVATAIIAALALREHVRISKITANYTAITTADSFLLQHPKLLALYNIDEDEMRSCGITSEGLLYLAESFHAAELYHRLDGAKQVVISEYRKNMLRNPKVREAWQRLIKNKFSFHAPLAAAIDEFIRTEELR